MNPFEVLWQYKYAFLQGFSVTVELVVFVAIIGTFIGVFLEVLCNFGGKYFRKTVDAIAFCVAAVPALVLLFWFYYPGQSLLGVSVSPFLTALVVLVIINSFSVYRIIADAVHDFPKQFISTGLVCGLSRVQIFVDIQIPLLIRATLPRWIDQNIVILQTSLFASLISVEEIFRAAQRINSVVYQPVTIYTAMAIVFLVVAGSAMYYAKCLRLRFYRDFSER